MTFYQLANQLMRHGSNAERWIKEGTCPGILAPDQYTDIRYPRWVQDNCLLGLNGNISQRRDQLNQLKRENKKDSICRDCWNRQVEFMEDPDYVGPDE